MSADGYGKRSAVIWCSASELVSEASYREKRSA